MSKRKKKSFGGSIGGKQGTVLTAVFGSQPNRKSFGFKVKRSKK